MADDGDGQWQCCFVVIVAVCIGGLLLFVTVGGHCRMSLFIIHCYVSPVSYVKKGERVGGFCYSPLYSLSGCCR